MNGAIYHFTNKSELRPIYCEKQIKELHKFAESLNIEVSDTFLDKSLLVEERCEFERFMASCGDYDALVTKDFYHISKNTRACMSILKELRAKGVTTYSIENGMFTFSEAPLDKPLKVATYTHSKPNVRDGKNLIRVQQEIYELFIKKKTNWTLVQHYSDICTHQVDAEQMKLMKLIEDKASFDLLLVTNLNDINWKTSRFCKLREVLSKDIFSLQDDFLEYRRSN